MAKRPITTITLPVERAEQLRAIAKARGVPVTELLAGFIQAEVRKGTIPDELDDLPVKVIRGHVEISFGKVAVRAGREEALEIAELLEDVCANRGLRWTDLPIMSSFAAERIGKGIRIWSHEAKRGRLGLVLKPLVEHEAE